MLLHCFGVEVFEVEQSGRGCRGSLPREHNNGLKGAGKETVQGCLRKPMVVERLETVDGRSERAWGSILARLPEH